MIGQKVAEEEGNFTTAQMSVARLTSFQVANPSCNPIGFLKGSSPFY